MTTTTTITSKSINTNYRGKGLHKKLRAAFIQDKYAHNFVLRKVALDKQGNIKEDYLAIVEDNPTIRVFGINTEYKAFNVLAYDTSDGKKVARRINIDGSKYIMVTSMMIINCEENKMVNKLAEEGYVCDGNKYVAAVASPSNEKHGDKFYALICEETPDEEEVFNKVSKAGGRALETLLYDEEGNDKLVSGKEIAKSNTRAGNFISGMIPLFDIDLAVERVAIVNGSMLQASDFTAEVTAKMLEAGIEIDSNINDGANYVNVYKIINWAFSKYHVRLTVEDALKVAIQSRTETLTTKVLSRAMRPEDLETLVECYKDQVTIYGNPNGPISMVVDTDGAKMINRFLLKQATTKMTVYGLAIANASVPNSSAQHLIKYVNVDAERTAAIIRDLAMAELDGFFGEKVESTTVAGLRNSRIIAKLSTEEILSDRFLMDSILADTFNFMQSMIAKNRVPLEGIYSHMMFDLSYALTKGLVKGILRKMNGVVEAFSNDICEIYEEEIAAIENNNELTEEEKDAALFELLCGVVVKFPSATPNEYEIIVYRTKKQIRRRIEEELAIVEDNELKEELIDVLVKYFDNTPWGCTVYAPINAMKNKLAGADVDFDATMCDMSPLKWILVEKRLQEQEELPGFMGHCTFIKYGAPATIPAEFYNNKIEETPKAEKAIEVEVNDDDIELF